jgi:hypothetical protein
MTIFFQILEGNDHNRDVLALKWVGMRLVTMYMVFHRILDFKTGWISILALFFCPSV